MEHQTEEFGIVVLSKFAGHAGRSALTLRFVEDRFVRDYDPLVEDSWRKTVTIDGVPYNLMILDTAGAEEGSLLLENYIRKNNAFLAVYDVTNRSTFDALEEVCDKISRVKEVAKNGLPIVVCGNKCDCSDGERQVQTSEGQKFADSYGYPFIETSAKTGHNVEKAFFTVVRFCSNINASGISNTEGVKHASRCIVC